MRPIRFVDAELPRRSAALFLVSLLLLGATPGGGVRDEPQPDPVTAGDGSPGEVAPRGGGGRGGTPKKTKKKTEAPSAQEHAPVDVVPPDLAPGARLELGGRRWRIEGEPLGSGEFGTTHRIRAETVGDAGENPAQLQILKQNRQRPGESQEIVAERTGREVEFQNLAADRSADRFVRARRVNDSSIVMPLAGDRDFGDGTEQLNRALQSGRIRDAEYRAVVRTIARDLVDAVTALGEAGIIHRDLNPANVRLDARGRVTVIDFGVAMRAGEGPDALLARGIPKPSSDYARGKGLEAPSDSFSAARMLRDFNRSSDMPDFGEFLDRLETAQGAAAIRALRDHAFLRLAADAEVDVSDVLTRAQQTSAAAPPRPKRPRKPLSYISGPPTDEDGEGSPED